MVWFHVPSGGFRRPIEAKILKGLGVKAGIPDLILLHDGKLFALELKTEKGRPSPAQLEMRDAINNAGGFAVIAYGLTQALKTLEIWSLVNGKIQ